MKQDSPDVVVQKELHLEAVVGHCLVIKLHGESIKSMRVLKETS